jgi:hypothetical protein
VVSITVAVTAIITMLMVLSWLGMTALIKLHPHLNPQQIDSFRVLSSKEMSAKPMLLVSYYSKM